MSEAIALLLQGRTGLMPQPADLQRAARRRMQHRGIADQGTYRNIIENDEQEFSALVDLVVVSETWLFREPQAFVAATGFVQERRAASALPVRILCIPCATGEEPYSLAMSLVDAGMDARHFSIDAIDISHAAIERAQLGCFGRNAFRTADLTFRDRHFEKIGDDHQLHPELRRLVQFRCLNLLTLGCIADVRAYDVIFCRNLLIYFDEAAQRIACQTLLQLLSDGGLLFAGHAEAPAFCRHGFLPVAGNSAFAVRRKTAMDVQDIGMAPHAKKESLRRPVLNLPFANPKAIPPSNWPDKPVAVAKTAQAERPDTLKSAANESASLLEQARQLADGGEFAVARRTFEAYLQAVPDSAEAYFMLGLISDHSDSDKSAAEAHLRRSLYLEPDNYEALCHLALLAEQRGNATDAANLRKRAVRVLRRQAERPRKP